MANLLARLDNKEYVILDDSAVKTKWQNKGYDIYNIAGTSKLLTNNLKTINYNQALAILEAYQSEFPGIVIDTAAIAGVTAPVTGATPVIKTTAGVGYTGTVSWDPSVETVFVTGTDYVATVTLKPAVNYKLDGVAEDFFTVAGGTATNAEDSGIVTVEFPTTTG